MLSGRVLQSLVRLNRTAIWVGALLAAHAGLLMFTAARTAPTIDEPAHLAAGLYQWRSGQCNVYVVNPPLVKGVAAFPVLILGAKEDWSRIAPPPNRSEWNVGEEFAIANGSRIFWLTTLARWACVPFCLLGGLACYGWSNRLFGPPCGFIALALWCCSPTVLGHGATINADAASAAVGVLAGYAFWMWLEQPTGERAVLNGLALGACWLVKLTWVILPVIWLLVWLLHRLSGATTRRSIVREIGQLAASCIVGVLTLNIGYAFEGTLTRLGDFQFTSCLLSGKPPHKDFPLPGNRFQGTALGSLPVPLPSSFVSGLDAQKQDFEEPRPLYFAGERSQSGWWYFYIAAVWLKEPLGTLGLGVLATLWCCRTGSRSAWLRLSAVWVPPLVLLLLVSCHPRLNYYRYMLPALPFALVWASQVGRLFAGGRHGSPVEGMASTAAVAVAELQPLHGSAGASPSLGRRTAQWVVGVCLLSAVVSGVASVPHSLSYVNVLWGGMREGHRWFIDGNFDWGQDLLALRQWMDRHPEARPLHVAYFGAVHPHLAGIEFAELSDEFFNPRMRDASFRIPAGWYAISASHVHGVKWHAHPTDRPGVRTVFEGGLTVFESETPIDRAGPSILIYRIEETP